MGSRTTLLVVVAALLLTAPAQAQDDPPAGLFEPAPTEDAGPVEPTDGGRSTLLLGIALVTVAGAGLLVALPVRPPRRTGTAATAGTPDTPAPAAPEPDAPAPSTPASRPAEAPTP